MSLFYFIPLYYIVYFLLLLLFIVILLSFGCSGKEISPFAGQIKKFCFWFWTINQIRHILIWSIHLKRIHEKSKVEISLILSDRYLNQTRSLWTECKRRTHVQRFISPLTNHWDLLQIMTFYLESHGDGGLFMAHGLCISMNCMMFSLNENCTVMVAGSNSQSSWFFTVNSLAFYHSYVILVKRSSICPLFLYCCYCWFIFLHAMLLPSDFWV